MDKELNVSMVRALKKHALLSFFGATHFDPRSDRWVRINMYRDAPFPHEMGKMDADDWSYPTVDG